MNPCRKPDRSAAVNEPTATVASQSGLPGPTTRNTQTSTGLSPSQTARNDTTTPSAPAQPPRANSPAAEGRASSTSSISAGAAPSSGSSSTRPRQPTIDSAGSGGGATDTNARRSPSPYSEAGSSAASASTGVRCRPASISAAAARSAPICPGRVSIAGSVSRRIRPAPANSPVSQIASSATGTTAIAPKKVIEAACNDRSRPRSGRNAARTSRRPRETMPPSFPHRGGRHSRTGGGPARGGPYGPA